MFDHVLEVRRILILLGIAFACGNIACSPKPGSTSDTGGMTDAEVFADGGDVGRSDGTDSGCDGDAGCSCDFRGKSQGVCGTASPSEDGSCTMPRDYERTESSCGDGLDNDCDGNKDCADPDCAGDRCGAGQGGATCVASSCKEQRCYDGVDNDGDGKTDCADPDCTGETCKRETQRTCPAPEKWEADDESSCDGVDNDCDGATDEGCSCTFDPGEPRSVDTDGSHDFGVCTDSERNDQGSCARPNSFESRSGDESACDGVDNDCDGTTDEGCGCTFDPMESNDTDTNGDYKHGVCVNQQSDPSGDCRRPSGFEPRTDAESSCNGMDNDCDGAIDEGCRCVFDPTQGNKSDTDGSHASGVCTAQMRDGSGICSRPRYFERRTDSESWCDGADNDCDGAVDEGCSCTYDPTEASNVDSNNTHDAGVCTGRTIDKTGSCRRPSKFEGTRGDAETGSSCIDGVDNDCDGSTDEGCSCVYDPNETRNIDSNGDHGAGVCKGQSIDASSGDCGRPNAFDPTDDENKANNCDGRDNDCDGVVDEFCACDYTGTSAGVCSNGQISTKTGSCSIAPGDYEKGEESCDGKDNDCDGSTDEWDDLNCTSLTSFGSGTNDRGMAIAVRDSGVSYVGGYADGPFGGQTHTGDADGFVAKFDADGNRKWVRIFGSSRDDEVQGVAVDGSGNLYVAGFTEGSFGGKSGAGAKDGFLAKYGPGGTRKWLRFFATNQPDEFHDVTHAGSGTLYVVGATAGAPAGATNSGKHDGVIAKFDTSGRRQWLRLIGGSEFDELQGVAADGPSTVYVAGYASSSVGGRTFSGYDDGLIARYDGSGNRSWVRLVGNSDRDRLESAAVDSTGDLYVAGNRLRAELLFGKFSPSGSRQWWKETGSDAAARGVAVLPNDRPVIVGETDTSLFNHTFKGGAGDIFAAEYATSGARKWSTLEGTSQWDDAHGVGVDSGGEVLGTGRWNGKLFGSSSDVWVGVLK